MADSGPSPDEGTARPEERSGLRARPYPFELVAWGLFALSATFLVLRGLPFNGVTLQYTFAPFVRRAPFFLLLGIGLQLAAGALFAFHRRDPAPVRDYLAGIFRLSWVLAWLRLYAAYMVSTYVYFWIKVVIPLVNQNLWDSSLWNLDRLLHLGLSPNILLVELVRGTPLPALLDQWYAWWLPSVMGVIAFFSASRHEPLRRSFMLSCVLLWGVGTWIYLTVPAMGPIYVQPESFQGVIEEMPSATGGQAVLWENYQKVLAGRSGRLGSFNPTRGIAALPSLHVAAHFLFALWARRFARPLWVPLLLGTLLTYLGSIVTGWHYAVDGYVALGLAYGVYRLSLWLEPVPTEEA